MDSIRFFNYRQPLYITVYIVAVYIVIHKAGLKILKHSLFCAYIYIYHDG